MRKLSLLLLLLITACSLPAATTPLPAGVVVITATPAAADSLLPVEAQRIIDRATATAAAAATQAAAAAATATSARLSTVQALEAAERSATLEAARQAAAAGATRQAAAETAAQAATAAPQTQAAAQTLVWATPTWAAVRTRAALDALAAPATATALAAQAARTAASARAAGSLAEALGVGALLVILALGAITAYWVYHRQETWAWAAEEIAQERVEQERERTQRVRDETNAARAAALGGLILERPDGPYLPTPDGRLVPLLPGSLAPVSHPNRARAHRWRSALKTLVLTGLALADGRGPRFGERDLAGERGAWVVNADGTPSSAGYRALARLLVMMGVWAVVDRKGTHWARDWDEARFAREFDLLPLPALPDGEPPEVRIAPRSAAVAAAIAVPAAPQ